MPEIARMSAEKNDSAHIHIAGEGYFFAPTIHPPTNINGGVIVGGVDEVRAIQFLLPCRAVVNRLLTEVTTVGGASTLYGVALYSADRNTLLKASGAIDANTTQQNLTTLTAFFLNPGVYWLAWTADTTSLQMRTTNIPGAGSLQFLSDTTTRRTGIAANAAPSPGTFPATLGAISAGLTEPPVALYFIE